MASRLPDCATVVFWDFDGVIKDSVGVKAAAFERLFTQFGPQVAERVRRHHEANGGRSRLEKIPLYLEWAGEAVTPELLHEYLQRFSQMVVKEVINCAWIPGVRAYLQAHHARQFSVLLTATPQAEIEQIVAALGVSHWFREIHGAPTPKTAAIGDVLARQSCPGDQALVVGDSATDLEAAQANNVLFLLRRTPQNCSLQRGYSGPTFDDLTDE